MSSLIGYDLFPNFGIIIFEIQGIKKLDLVTVLGHSPPPRTGQGSFRPNCSSKRKKSAARMTNLPAVYNRSINDPGQ